MGVYKIGDFSKKVGMTVRTLQLWDKKGVLTAKRTITNQRYYTDEDYEKCMNLARK